jgi:hypothetical protein
MIVPSLLVATFLCRARPSAVSLRFVEPESGSVAPFSETPALPREFIETCHHSCFAPQGKRTPVRDNTLLQLERVKDPFPHHDGY